MVDHIADARKLGVEVQPPNVNNRQRRVRRAEREDRLPA